MNQHETTVAVDVVMTEAIFSSCNNSLSSPLCPLRVRDPYRMQQIDAAMDRAGPNPPSVQRARDWATMGDGYWKDLVADYGLDGRSAQIKRVKKAG